MDLTDTSIEVYGKALQEEWVMRIKERKMIRVLLLCFLLFPLTPAVAQVSCDQTEVDLLTTPAPPTNKYSAAALAKTVVPEGIDVAILGDSIANQLATGGLFDALRSKQPFLLAGGGDGFPQAFYRLGKFQKQLIKSSPNKVVIVMGTNSLGGPLCALQISFAKYINEIRDIWPQAHLFIVPILPRGATYSYNETRAPYNKFLRASADELGFSVIDIDDSMLSCGIVGSENAAKFETRFGSITANKSCGDVNFAEIKNIAGMIGPGVSAQCTAVATLTCENYRDDNVHMSPKGLDLLIRSVVAKME